MLPFLTLSLAACPSPQPASPQHPATPTHAARYLQNAIGSVPSPFDCYLALRGLKTLHVRMDAAQRNALAVAQMLEGHARVERLIRSVREKLRALLGDTATDYAGAMPEVIAAINLATHRMTGASPNEAHFGVTFELDERERLLPHHAGGGEALEDDLDDTLSRNMFASSAVTQRNFNRRWSSGTSCTT